MPEARSVTTGFWVAVGGCDEPAELAGASHFLEHLVFKDRKSTRLNSSHSSISYAVFCLKKKKNVSRVSRSGAAFSDLPPDMGHLRPAFRVLRHSFFRSNRIDLTAAHYRAICRSSLRVEG